MSWFHLTRSSLLPLAKPSVAFWMSWQRSSPVDDVQQFVDKGESLASFGFENVKSLSPFSASEWGLTEEGSFRCVEVFTRRGRSYLTAEPMLTITSTPLQVLGLPPASLELLRRAGCGGDHGVLKEQQRGDHGQPAGQPDHDSRPAALH